MTQAHHSGLLAQLQDLNEQIAQGIKVPAAEFTDATVIRLLVTDQHPKRQVLVARAPDLAGGDDAHAAGVEQQVRQPLRGRLRLHAPIQPCLPAGILGLSRDQDRGEIEFIHQIQQEIRQVVIREPVTG